MQPARGAVALASTLVALLAVLAPAPAAAIQFVSSLSSVKVQGEQGSVHFREFRLKLSEGSEGALFRVKLEDWWQSPDGQRSHYAAPGTLERSCARWVGVEPLQAQVAPGGELVLNLAIRVPDRVPSGGYWCVLTVDEVPDLRQAPAGVGAIFSASISTGIFVEVGAVRREARITAVDLDAASARVRVENTGDTPVGIEGRLEFLDAEGEAVRAVVDLARVTALTEPIRDRILAAELPDRSILPSGRYLVRAVLDYGAEHLIGVQRLVDVDRSAAP
ncbi:MAG TPA: hypothetical protein VHQ65_16120 [Thermoanaerobaculia bacterium]|nr:hypothetical protein [Thermoanaerobaculia bacterium]